MIKLLLALFISTASFAAQPGAVPSVTVSAPGANTGSVNISPAMLSGTGINKIFSLYMGLVGTGGNFYGLVYNGAAYQVGAATGSYGTVKAYCFDVTGGGNYTVGLLFQLVSSSNTIAVGGQGSITGTTQYQGGAAGSYPSMTGANNSVAVVPGLFTFNASSYPGVQIQSGTYFYQIHMDCFEQ